MATLKLTSFAGTLDNRIALSSNLSITSDATTIYFQSSLNATNIGGPNGIYLNISNSFLNFKSLNAGSFLSIASTNTTLVINATNVVQAAGSYISIDANGIISNTAPDQIVNLSSTTLVVSNTYPNFTLNFTGASLSYTAGSYININSGVISNIAPDQVLTLVGFNGISITGVYPSYGVVGPSITNGGTVYGFVYVSTGYYNFQTKNASYYNGFPLPNTGIFFNLCVKAISGISISGVVSLYKNATTTSLNVTMAGTIGYNFTDVVIVNPWDSIALFASSVSFSNNALLFSIAYRNL